MSTKATNAYHLLFYKNVKILDMVLSEDISFLQESPECFYVPTKEPIMNVARILNPVYRTIHLLYHKQYNGESIINYFSDIIRDHAHRHGIRVNGQDVSMHPIHIRNNKIWIYDFNSDQEYPLPRNINDLRKFMKFVKFIIKTIHKTPCKSMSTLMSDHEYKFLKKHQFHVAVHFIWYFNRRMYFNPTASIRCKNPDNWERTMSNYIDM